MAQLAYDSFLYFHSKRYEMICFTIMSNHVHLLFWLNEDRALYGVMHSLKRYIANKANQLLDREGAFWARESYDRAVRNNQELKRIIHYILMNPVKAGVVKNWEDYPWTFVNEKYFPF
ncbi:MAG TPA: transposase [Emticicia sp.]